MKLKDELGRNYDFNNIDIEILVSAVYLSKCINRLSMDFFNTFSFKQGTKDYKVTDMQFNALVILHDRHGEETLQTELAERLLINKSSAGTLIDKLEARQWITRTAKDRRANLISISDHGIKVLEQTVPAFDAACSEIIKTFSQKDKKLFLELLNRYRSEIITKNQSL